MNCAVSVHYAFYVWNSSLLLLGPWTTVVKDCELPPWNDSGESPLLQLLFDAIGRERHIDPIIKRFLHVKEFLAARWDGNFVEAGIPTLGASMEANVSLSTAVKCFDRAA